MKSSIEHKRFKQIREALGYTQVEFGKIIGISSSTADIERGKTRISGYITMKLFKDFQINPLWLFGESKKKNIDPSPISTIPKAITINSEGRENILLINAKAAAGYGSNRGDFEYIEQFPAFALPLPQYNNATFRGFEIIGDSMTPLVYPGDWVLAKAVHSFSDVSDGKIYIIVEKQSIRLKKIVLKENKNHIELHSLNQEYPSVRISTESILELWEYHSKIGFGKQKNIELSINDLHKEIREMKNQIRSFQLSLKNLEKEN